MQRWYHDIYLDQIWYKLITLKCFPINEIIQFQGTVLRNIGMAPIVDQNRLTLHTKANNFFKCMRDINTLLSSGTAVSKIYLRHL